MSIQTPSIPDGTPVWIDGATMHASPLCPLIEGAAEEGVYPARTGFVCVCVDRAVGIDLSQPTIDPRLAAQADAVAPSLDPPDFGNGPAKPKAPVKQYSDADVVALILANHGKFEVHQVDDGLARWAHAWLQAYQGDFEFLLDVRSKAKASLSPGQAKGVLNCARAGLFRGEWGQEHLPAKDEPAEPEYVVSTHDGPNGIVRTVTTTDDGLDLSGVPSGLYAVPGGDTRLKVKIDNVDKPGTKWHGWVFVKDGAAYGHGDRYGSQKPGGTYRGKIQQQLEIIASDPYAAAAAYGQLTGTCGRCGRQLEDEESVARGIGPVCATKAW